MWAPENAAPKRSDSAEDVKDADITGVDVDFEAERRCLAEGELDEGRRARDLAPRRAANGRTDERTNGRCDASGGVAHETPIRLLGPPAWVNAAAVVVASRRRRRRRAGNISRTRGGNAG